jgi:sterol desaturase/sphingolipid hydroxylase (fatty acid hydroxylase superfamily)
MWREDVLPYLWYPVLMLAAAATYAAMLRDGASPLVAAYLPVVVVALAIAALEIWFPERLEWRPQRGDVKTDLAFLVLVQVALQRGLAALCIMAISAKMHAHAPSDLWPRSWPLAAQVVTMVLAVDFIRYWLHRACHHSKALWRLHEVHHAPNILYTLNVGRFHPIEKSLQFCCDTVPFLLLGVAPEVIAGYLLLYATNGFFQHSNLRLRYGWLNYLVGSAETHRWHHARNPQNAACNFGNTTILWDLLFGTWYLPGAERLTDIGVMDATYPKNFWRQLCTPFRPIRRQISAEKSFKASFAQALLSMRLRYLRLVSGIRVAVAARNPMRAQRRLLASILKCNQSTDFGRQYSFARIRTYGDFVGCVPVSDFEALRPYVDADIAGNRTALTRQPPRQYVRTSGTTGQPKDVPLTPQHLRLLRRSNSAALAFQFGICPEAFAGGILAFTSPAIEGALRNGKSFGSASGIVAGNVPALVLGKFVVPSAVMSITDSRLKYLLILRLALARRDITYAGAANSTTLLTLMTLYREYCSKLLDDLRHGTFFLSDRLTADVRAAIRDRICPEPGRAEELAWLHITRRRVRLADLWPELRMVATWTGGSASVALHALRTELPLRARILELGYLSSEFRGTITVGRRSGSGFPTLDTHFFEFVEREKWDCGVPEFLTLDGIRKGVDYYVIVTTPSGLYRYFINDLVRVQGYLHKTPLLKFIQKGKGVTNITGEKLYESQVLMAVRAVTEKLGRGTRFVMMLADEVARCYRLYVELDTGPALSATCFAWAVDEKLHEINGEYSAKRESRRLGGLDVFWLRPETAEAYKDFSVQQGQREGQFKSVAIAYRKSFAFDLDAYVEGCP